LRAMPNDRSSAVDMKSISGYFQSINKGRYRFGGSGRPVFSGRTMILHYSSQYHEDKPDNRQDSTDKHDFGSIVLCYQIFSVTLLGFRRIIQYLDFRPYTDIFQFIRGRADDASVFFTFDRIGYLEFTDRLAHLGAYHPVEYVLHLCLASARHHGHLRVCTYCATPAITAMRPASASTIPIVFMLPSLLCYCEHDIL
jgi:hypothetical protein